jgi:hypothetical protein
VFSHVTIIHEVVFAFSVSMFPHFLATCGRSRIKKHAYVSPQHRKAAPASQVGKSYFSVNGLSKGFGTRK